MIMTHKKEDFFKAIADIVGREKKLPIVETTFMSDHDLMIETDTGQIFVLTLYEITG